MTQQQNDRSPDAGRLYAWLSRDEDGIEGLVAIPTATGFLPLVVADEARARSFKGFASLAARERGYAARLVMFERAGEPLDEVGP